MAEEYTGGSVSYYAVDINRPLDKKSGPYKAECQDIIDALGMDFNEGCAFKAIWRRAAARNLGLRKKGYDDGLYDAQKVEFYGMRMVAKAETLSTTADHDRDEVPQAGPEGWIEHDGSAMPVPEGVLIDVRDQDGTVWPGQKAGDFANREIHWRWQGNADSRIVAYRLA